MSNPIPVRSEIRRPLPYIAFWQGMTFILLIAALWNCEALGLLHDGPPDEKWLIIPTILLVLGGVVAVGHTYLQERRVLSGIVTVCSYCRKVRIEEAAWTQIENFVSRHSRADFSHGICPECFDRLTAEMAADDKKEPSGGRDKGA